MLSHVQLFETSWTVSSPSGFSVEFSRRKYWSGLPFIPFSRGSSLPRDGTWVSCVAGRFFTTETPGKPHGNSTFNHLKTAGQSSVHIPASRMKVKVPQSCLTFESHPTGYTVHGVLQARILEWVTVPFSRGSSQSRNQTQVSCIAGRFFTS